MASLDEYFKKRTEGFQSPTTTAAPVDASKPADPASSYIDRISQTLAGNDPVVKNARQDASTKNAVGDYLANRQAKQESVGAGYTPGTLQSQRTADRYQAGANEAALGRDAGVNDLSRQRTDTAMSQANQLRQEGVQQTETLRKEGLAEIETLINSITDPVTQAAARRIQASGGDVRAFIGGNSNGQQGTNTIPPTTNGQGSPTNPNNTTGGTGTGTGTTGYVDEFGRPRQGTPAELAAEAAKDWMKTAFPDLDPNSDEYKELYQAQLGGAKQAEVDAIIAGNKKKKKDARNEKALTSGLQALSDKEYSDFVGDLPITTGSAIPTDKAGIDALKASGTPFIKTNDGQVYQIQDYLQSTRWENGSKDRHSDYAVGVGRDGKQVWIDTDGQVIPYKPPNAPSGSKVKYDPEAKVFRLYYGGSGGSRGQHYDPATQKWVRD